MFGRILAFDSLAHASQYLMVARGIFKETTSVRRRVWEMAQSVLSQRGRQEYPRSAEHL